jgi:hypothetical protein
MNVHKWILLVFGLNSFPGWRRGRVGTKELAGRAHLHQRQAPAARMETGVQVDRDRSESRPSLADLLLSCLLTVVGLIAILANLPTNHGPTRVESRRAYVPLLVLT